MIKAIKPLALIILAAIISLIAWLILKQPTTPPAPEFKEFAAGPERKKAFFDYFLPIINEENREILKTREQLLSYRDEQSYSSIDEKDIQELAEKYYLDDFDIDNEEHWQTLLRRVDYVPPSLALAQAANESAWGTSRFATEGNNYFGQWCFAEGCGLVPKNRTPGSNHEVAAFDDARESVNRYLLNLNRHDAYFKLRKIREDIRENEDLIRGRALLPGLERYSERGTHYMDELDDMIQFNKLNRFDTEFLAQLTEPEIE